MGSVRVVIVDDFEPWRRTVCSILEQYGSLEVVGECSDGEEAVRRCGELQPDLVLLDVGLPTLNGLEAARQIRKVSPASKIVFLSSNPSPEVMREALRIGAGGYVVKLDASRDLLPAVRSAVMDKEFVSFRFLEDGSTEPPEG